MTWVLNFLASLGNSLIVNIGLTDLVVTIVVIPISIVSLLAMNKDEDVAPLSVCKFQWFLAACAFLVSVLTLAVSRLIFSTHPHLKFNSSSSSIHTTTVEWMSQFIKTLPPTQNSGVHEKFVTGKLHNLQCKKGEKVSKLFFLFAFFSHLLNLNLKWQHTFMRGRAN